AQYRVEIFDGFRLFEFCNHRRILFRAADQLLCKDNIFRSPYETHRDVVGFASQSKSQIRFILRRQSGNAQFDSRQIDSFVFSESAAIHYFANHFGFLYPTHSQFDQTVGEKNSVAGVNFARERLEHGVDARGVPQDLRRGDGEFLTCAEENWAATGQGAGADFGPLQVREDGDGLLLLRCGGAEEGDASGVLIVGTVGEIQAGDVHAGLEEFFDYGWRAGS